MKITTAYSVLALAASVSLPLQADTSQFKVIYNFTGGTDGITPKAGLIIGKGGVLYGTTFGDYSGPAEEGAVFSLTPPSNLGGAWTETTLFDFSINTGVYPVGSLAIGPGGSLYGTTTEASPSGLGSGTLFSLTPPSNGTAPWSEQTLYEFTDAPAGFRPISNVIFGLDGNLYGTTFYGAKFNLGSVYAAVRPADSGGSWASYPLHVFGSYPGDGYYPGEGLVVGNGGVLYGVTQAGGTGGESGSGYAGGTVYSINPPSASGGLWTEQVLYSFSGHNEGAQPASVLTIDKNGVLYGTTSKGPQGVGGGCGAVFSLAPPRAAGGKWVEQNLYFFQGSSDGCVPFGGVVFGRDGNLYGTTVAGGDMNHGTLYSLAPPTDSGDKWVHRVVHSLSYADGTGPGTSLVLGAGGVLYGVAPSGGIGYGTVFAFKP